LSAWLKLQHYTHRTPPGYAFALEFSFDRQRIGAMVVGRLGPRSLDPDRIMELTRMHFVDDTPLCTESHALSMKRRHVPVWLPQIQPLGADAVGS
jgi:hypothetical protein